MARREEVRVFLTDDLDGTELPEGKGQTVRFGISGEWYEIDLKDQNAKKMLDAFGEYTKHARRWHDTTGTRRRRSTGRRSEATHDRDETRAARAWLVKAGYLSAESRGRIKAELWELYRERGGRGQQTSIDTGPTVADVDKRTREAEPAKAAAPSLQETKGEVPAKKAAPAVNGNPPAAPAKKAQAAAATS